MAIQSTYFFMVVSVSDLIEWNEAELVARPNPCLDRVLTAFNIELDLLGLHDRYFDTIIVGQGDVFLYKASADSEDLLVFDFYKESSDQLDLISIGLRCSPDKVEKIREDIHAFYHMAETRVCLEESELSAKVIEMIEDSNYPKVFQHTGYRQKLRVYLTAQRPC